MKSPLRILSCAVVATALPLTAQRSEAPSSESTILEATRVVLAAGEALDGEAARLAIRDGKVVAVGREIGAEMLGRSRRVRLPAGAIVVPGFVALNDQLDLGAELAESIHAFTPELRAADAFDPFDRVLPWRARSGVTGIVLAPASVNTFAGIASLVKWDGERGRVAAADGYLKLALVDSSLSRERYPTSRMGAADLVRQAFADASDPLLGVGPEYAVLREVKDQSRRVAIHASSHGELVGAIDLARELGLAPVLLDVVEPDECIELLKGSSVTIALRPLDWGSRVALLEAPAKLASAGVRFSFAGTTGNALRRSAALAIKHGLDRRTALDAITRIPAEQAGFGERLGTLRVGRDADFVVFDGDPTELTSRLLETWVDGRRVHSSRSESNQESIR